MEMGRGGHSALYTMHFSNLFPPPLETSGDGKESKESKESGDTGSATASSSPPCSVTQFTQWHVLIRINSENGVCFAESNAKVFSPTPSLASPMARGVKPNGEPAANVTEPDGIPIVPIPQRDRQCNVLMEGTSGTIEDGKELLSLGGDGREQDEEPSFRLEVHFSKLEAELLGLREPEMLEDVTFTCIGEKGCGWQIGQVAVAVGGTPLAMPRPLRFLLKSFFGQRCTYCLDPVYAIGYTCDACEATQYCSRECLQTHTRQGHGLLCPHLKNRYRVRSGHVATEVTNGSPLVAWWRCLDNGEYSILVDSKEALGYPIEYTISALSSPQEDGLQYRFLFPTGPTPGSSATPTPSGTGKDNSKAGGSGAVPQTTASSSPPIPTEEEVIDFTYVLLREVNRSAILEGCVSLSSACLNYLYYFSPSTVITIQSHALFFNAFYCEELDGPITLVEEYVAYARPIRALAVLQLEHALKSSISREFWHRIKFAKDAAIALVSINSMKPCSSFADMDSVIATQRAESLLLLCKIFVTMATRAPEEKSRHWLEQAERSLRQCIDGREDVRSRAMNQYRLAALLLLYRDPARDSEAAELRALATVALNAMEDAAEADPVQQQKGSEENEMKALEGTKAA